MAGRLRMATFIPVVGGNALCWNLDCAFALVSAQAAVVCSLVFEKSGLWQQNGALGKLFVCVHLHSRRHLSLWRDDASRSCKKVSAYRLLLSEMKIPRFSKVPITLQHSRLQYCKALGNHSHLSPGRNCRKCRNCRNKAATMRSRVQQHQSRTSSDNEASMGKMHWTDEDCSTCLMSYCDKQKYIRS